MFVEPRIDIRAKPNQPERASVRFASMKTGASALRLIQRIDFTFSFGRLGL
jgi:hypothetical protein